VYQVCCGADLHGEDEGSASQVPVQHGGAAGDRNQ